MGCDIHCYIEHSREPREGDDRYWSPFGGRNNPGRNYKIFGRIAGVRCGGQMFPLRGLPSPLAYEARGDNELYVVEHETEESSYASRTQADRWVASGSSRYTDERKAFVTHPDWHSHTWLAPAEWRRVIEALGEWGVDDEYFAMAVVMEELECWGN